MPMREAEDAMIRGEAPPVHPDRPPLEPIGPETGAGLSPSGLPAPLPHSPLPRRCSPARA